MFSNHRPEISFFKESSLFILVLSFATVGYFITIPSTWHPYLPDVFFVAWCVLYAKYRYRQSHAMHYVVAWIFGLTADFFTSGSLGANALTYLIIALWADQFDIAPKVQGLFGVFADYSLMFLIFYALKNMSMSWIGHQINLTPSLMSFFITYCFGLIIVVVRL